MEIAWCEEDARLPNSLSRKACRHSFWMPPVVAAPGDASGSSLRRATAERGLHYSADPPTMAKIIIVVCSVGDRIGGDWLPGLIVMLPALVVTVLA